MFSPAAEPSLSHFACSFQGKAVSRLPLGSTIRGGSFFAQEASALAKQKREAILKNLKQVESKIRASINDDISRLHLDPAGQAAGDDIADGGGWFN